MAVSRIVTEIATVMRLEGGSETASQVSAALGKMKEGYDAQTEAASRAKVATEGLTESQKAAAVEAARLAEAEEKSARAIAAARKSQAQAEAELSKVKSAQLKGDTLGEASSTAQRAMLADRADRRSDVARMRIDKEADRLDEPSRQAWAEMRKSFAAGPKGSAGWRAAVEGAAPGAFENEGLRKLAEKRLAFETGQERIQTFGADAVQRTQDSFDLGIQKKADREREQAERKAAAQQRMKDAENRRAESLKRRLEAEARRVRREAEAAQRRAAADARRDDASKVRQEKATTREFEGARDAIPAAIDAEIRANERLQKAIARTTQERKKGNVEGIAGAELAQKHAQHDAEEAARGTKDAIARVLKTLLDDEREAFALMEAAVARMTAKGISEMGAWRMAAIQAAKGVRAELGAAMKGPTLSGIAKGLAIKADFGAAAAKYRDVASNVDMVGRSARRASHDVKLLNDNLRRGFSRSLSGVNELAGGIGQFASFSFGAFRNITFMVRTLSGAIRGVVGVVHGAVRAGVSGITSLVRGVSRLTTGLARLAFRTGVGFMSGAIHAVERLTGLVKDLVLQVERATLGLVHMSERAASAALHWGKWAAIGVVGIGIAATREGMKDGEALADDAGKLREASQASDMSASKDKPVVDPEAAAHPGEMGNRTGYHLMGSLQSGTDTDMAQALKGLASRNDVANDKLQEVIKGLGVSMRDAINDPNSPQAQMFSQLRVRLTQRDAMGRLQARSLDDVFGDVSGAIARDPNASRDPAAKAALYEKIFGTADAARIDPVVQGLANGGDRKEIERQQYLGTFISKADIERSKEFRKVVQDLRDAFRGVRMEIGRQLMPYLSQWSKETTAWLVRNREAIAGMVTRTVVAAHRIGVTLLEKAREVAYGVFVLYERFAAGQTVLQRFIGWLDRIDLASKTYRAGFDVWITYLVLVKREVGNVMDLLHRRGIGNSPFGLQLTTVGQLVMGLAKLEDVLTKVAFLVYDVTAKFGRDHGGWAKVRADVHATGQAFLRTSDSVIRFSREVVQALGGMQGIGNGIRQTTGFVIQIGRALMGFAVAHNLNHGNTWVRFFSRLAKAVGDAYAWVAPRLKAFARDLKTVLTGDEWAARDSKVLTKLVDLRNRLVAWAKNVLKDLKNVFVNGRDADGIQTWVGSVAKWMMWVVSKLPEWWEKIKAAYKEGSDFVKAAWKAMVQIVHGEQTDYPWLNRLVEHLKHLIDWLKMLFKAFETVHSWMEKFREATGWDLESGLMFLAIARMSGLLGIATGAWKLLTGGIQATAGVLQAFIALCRGDLAGVVGIIGRALGLTSVVEGAGGMAGAAGMVGMGANGAATALGGGAPSAFQGLYKAYRGMDINMPGMLGRGLGGAALPGWASAGVIGAAAAGGDFAVQVMKQNAEEETQHISDMQELRNGSEKSWRGVAHGLFEELDNVRRMADGSLNDGHGSESWRRDFNTLWKANGSQAAKVIAQKFNVQIDGKDVLEVSEEGVARAILNSKYKLQSETPYQ